MKVSFMGKVLEATCECHKGQWFTVAFLIEGNQERIPIADHLWSDKKSAKDGLENFVRKAAEETLKIIGMNPDEAKLTVFTGENAEKDFKKYLRESDTNLH